MNSSIKNIFGKAALTLALMLLGVSANAANYYVATTGNGGNDGNIGSSGSPWATITYAVSKSVSGDTIHVGSGTFSVTTQTDIPSGVTLVGAGASSTTVVGGGSEGVVFSMHSVTSGSITDMTLDGNNLAIGIGIYLESCSGVSLERLNFQNFLNKALSITHTSNSDFGFFNIKNCTHDGTSTTGSDATIAFDTGANDKYHDMNIDTLDYRGGDGLRSHNDGTVSVMDNVEFTNLTVNVPSTVQDSGVVYAAICIELYDSDCKNVEIDHCNFNNNISLVYGVTPNRSPSIHVDNNTWNVINGGYAMEIDYDNLQIDHNYVYGGGYPMGFFSSQLHTNLLVHHNVFETSAADSACALLYGGINGFKFYNNTVVDNANYRMFYLGTNSSNVSIENNIFSPQQTTSDFADLGSGATYSADHNLFNNIGAVGTNAISANPKFTNSGAKPSPFWTLASNSPAINAGLVISGITDGYVGSAPDLGAYEYGSSSTGSAPAAPTLSGTAGNGSVSLSWNAPTGATSYQVKYGTSTGNYTTTLASQSGTTANISSLTNGAKYYFVVTASNSYGTSGNSNELPLTPSSTTATKPVITITASSLSTGTTVAPGVAVTYSVTFKNTGTALTNGVLGIRIKNSAGTTTDSYTISSVNIASGASQTLTYTSKTPKTTGAYTLVGGAWSTGSVTTYVYANALTFTVSTGGGTVNGSLTGSIAASPSSDNLTTEGTTDWAHWGDGSAPGMNHKSSGGGKISAYSVVGSGTASYFTNSPVSYSWTDGSPTASQSGTNNGVYVAAANNGFSFTAPADTTTRTLKVYVGAANATGKMTAHLSDGSAADYVDTSLNDTGSVGGGTAKCYTLVYNAKTSGQTLSITWIVGTDHGGGNINLQAATLH